MEGGAVPFCLTVCARTDRQFSVSYVVDYMKRTSVKDQLFTKIVDEVVKGNGKLEWSSTAVGVVT